jgi:hypothetical protein
MIGAMRGWVRGTLIAASAIAACKFTPSSATQMIDSGPTPDAGPCEALSATCADDATLRTCMTIGQIPSDVTCAWGCIGPDAHCGVLVPTGSAATADDVTNDSQLEDITIADDIDGDDGSIKPGLRGAGSGVIAGIDYKVVNGIAVFRAKSWHFTHDMNLDGALPMVLVATGDITIDPTINVDARGRCGATPGLGGFLGAMSAGANALGSGGGVGGGTTDDSHGGGGGGHGGAGGVGANVPNSGGTPFGDPELAILVGGGGGGNGGDGATGSGGNGGGAIQLVAGGMISIADSADINAGGCGGHTGDSGDSGGGGGAGGAILLEAHDLEIMGALAVNGGGGGPGGNGTSGSRGGANRTPAVGGNGGQALGGSGAAGAMLSGFPGVVGSHSGGGGGGVGIMRLNSRTGSATVGSTAVLSPNFDDPGTTITQGSAHVQ